MYFQQNCVENSRREKNVKSTQRVFDENHRYLRV